MSQITTPESMNTSMEEVLPVASTEGDPTDADAQAFLDQLNADASTSEAEMQQQFDRNFQTMSYQFLKNIFSYAEEEIKKRR